MLEPHCVVETQLLLATIGAQTYCLAVKNSCAKRNEGFRKRKIPLQRDISDLPSCGRKISIYGDHSGDLRIGERHPQRRAGQSARPKISATQVQSEHIETYPATIASLVCHAHEWTSFTFLIFQSIHGPTRAVQNSWTKMEGTLENY